jgi:hypothetical protein
MITFFGGWLVTFAVSYFLPGIGWVFAAIGSVAAFVVVVFYHRRLDRVQVRYRKAHSWFTSQLARLTLAWAQLPPPPQIALAGDHPFARDLNLVGPQSLLHLVDTCTTQGGHERLQAWLCYPSLNTAEIRERQAVIREMMALPGFRNRLMLQSLPEEPDQLPDWKAEKILKWLESGPAPASMKPTLFVLSLLAILNVALLLLNLFQVIPAFWQFSFVLYAGIYLFRYQQYKSLFQDAMTLGQVLRQFQVVLGFLETYPYRGGE